MKPVMYLFLNRGLGMSTGKSCAQVAHAACEAQRISDPKLVDAWNSGGHYTKLVMLAEDAEQLRTFCDYIERRGFKTSLIIDEGRTEIKPFSLTALGVEIVDKDEQHVLDSFGDFKVYPRSKPTILYHGRGRCEECGVSNKCYHMPSCTQNIIQWSRG